MRDLYLDSVDGALRTRGVTCRLRIASARPLPAAWRWRLDGRVIGSATTRQVLPWPGPHRIELLDGAGAVRETVTYEVRGAAATQADRRPTHLRASAIVAKTR